MEAKDKEIRAWFAERAAKEKKGLTVNPNDVCPVEPAKAIMGLVFEYGVSAAHFGASCLTFFDDAVASLQDMQQATRFVMQRLFFPRPKLVRVPEADTDWVCALRQRLARALEGALAPPAAFLDSLKV